MHSIIKYPVNLLFSFNTFVSVNCSNTELNDIRLIGIEKANMITQKNGSKTLIFIKWYTNIIDVGSHIFCISARDSNDLVTIKCQKVSLLDIKLSYDFNTKKPHGLLDYNVLTQSVNNKVLWSIDTNRPITPNRISSIAIFTADGVSYENISAFNVSVNEKTVEFLTTNFFPNGNYYIKIKFGLGRDKEFQDLMTPAIEANIWTFSFNSDHISLYLNENSLNLSYVGGTYVFKIEANRNILKTTNGSIGITLLSNPETQIKRLYSHDPFITISGQFLQFEISNIILDGPYILTFDEELLVDTKLSYLKSRYLRLKVNIKTGNISASLQIIQNRVNKVKYGNKHATNSMIAPKNQPRKMLLTTREPKLLLCVPQVNINEEYKNVSLKQTDTILVTASVRLSLNFSFLNTKEWIINYLGPNNPHKVNLKDIKSLYTTELVIPPNMLSPGIYRFDLVVQMSHNSSCKSSDYAFFYVSYSQASSLRAFDSDETELKVLRSANLVFSPHIYYYGRNLKVPIDEAKIKYYCRILDSFPEYPKNNSHFLMDLKQLLKDPINRGMRTCLNSKNLIISLPYFIIFIFFH